MYFESTPCKWIASFNLFPANLQLWTVNGEFHLSQMRHSKHVERLFISKQISVNSSTENEDFIFLFSIPILIYIQMQMYIDVDIYKLYTEKKSSTVQRQLIMMSSTVSNEMCSRIDFVLMLSSWFWMKMSFTPWAFQPNLSIQDFNSLSFTLRKSHNIRLSIRWYVIFTTMPI